MVSKNSDASKSQIDLDNFDEIIFHFDGNNNDKDDIAALPIAAALTKSAGLEKKMTFFYGNNISEPNKTGQVKAMRESGAFAEKLGIETYSYQDGIDKTTDELVKILDSGKKILAIEGGPMEAIYRALDQARPQNRSNVVLLSHSSWNENRAQGNRPGGGKPRTWNDIRSDFSEVTQIEIQDQNDGNNNTRGFNSYKWDWLDNTENPVLQEAREKMVNADGKVNDPSDAGMLFYIITGQETANPDHAKAFFDQYPPTLVEASSAPKSSTSSPTIEPKSVPHNDNAGGDVFVAQNGQLVIEAESTTPVGDWKGVSLDGETSLLWDAPKSSYGKVPEGQTLSYHFETDEAGDYRIAMHSGRVKSVMNSGDRFHNGSSGKERTDTGNDAYVSIVNSETGDVIQKPIKLFTGLGNSDKELRWGTTFDANHRKSQAEVKLEADTQYRLDISGRSDGYVLNRITLSNDRALKDLAASESPLKGNGSSPPRSNASESMTTEPEPRNNTAPNKPISDSTSDLSRSSNQELITFALVDPETDKIIDGYEKLLGGESLDLSDLELSKYSVIAQVNPDHPEAEKVESIKFESNQGDRIENVKPYALFGDRNGDFWGKGLETGDVSIQATAYTQNQGKGEMLGSASISYIITDIPEENITVSNSAKRNDKKNGKVADYPLTPMPTANDSGTSNSDESEPDVLDTVNTGNEKGITLAIGKDTAKGQIDGTNKDDVISIRTLANNSTITQVGEGEDKVVLYGADQIPAGNYHTLLDNLKKNPLEVATKHFGATHSVDLGADNNADTLSLISEIDALPKFLLKHTDNNGRINGKGVAGENDKAYDHWAGVFGAITISNFDPEKDKLEIQGHTTKLGESFTKDGDFYQTIYSEQNANNKSGPREGAAHDDTFLGLLKFEGGATFADRISATLDVEGMKNYVVDGLGKEVFEGDPTSNQRGDNISDQPLFSYHLVNSKTDEMVKGYENLESGAEINLNGLNLSEYSIVAQINPDHIYTDLVESVRFKSNLGSRIENVDPYTLFSNKGNDYKGKAPSLGNYRIQTTAYSKNNGKGKTIESAKLEYTIVDIGSEPSSTPIPEPETVADLQPSAVKPFTLSALKSYGGGKQDQSLDVTLSDNDTTVRMVGNGWKKIAGNYTITPETVLEFEFRSTSEGEIHSIGFDNNNAITRSDQDKVFQLFGEQTWGLQDFASYLAESGWQSIEIPVGKYFQGEMKYLTFGNDHDDILMSERPGMSEFRNIILHEASAGMGESLFMSEDILNGTMLPDVIDEKANQSVTQSETAMM